MEKLGNSTIPSAFLTSWAVPGLPIGILEAIRTFGALQPKHVRKVRIVLYAEGDLSRWRTVMRSM